ncbi:MAG: ankyrin repeat domain-containing protein [Pseudomonadota bacterium]
MSLSTVAQDGSAASHQDEESVRAYLIAAALQQMQKVQHFVESRGLHPDATYGGKPTALCYSVLKPNLCLMIYLMERGADVNAVDGMGMTPLHYATLGGCRFCVVYLLARGARPDRENASGKTPLDLTDGRPDLTATRSALLSGGFELNPYPSPSVIGTSTSLH